MKKTIALLLALLLCMSVLAACGNNNSNTTADTTPAENTPSDSQTPDTAPSEPENNTTPEETAPATRTVTDMSGVEVEIPNEVNTYVESWFAHNAVDLMLDKAEGMLITCASPTQHQWMYIVCPNFWNAVSTTFSTDMSLEEIIAAKPDVVFGSNDNYREMFNNVGIPFINCSFKNYDQLKQSIKLTAEVFGGDAVEKADRYVEYLDSRIAWVAERTNDIPDDERISVAHGSSVYELDFDGANTIIDEWIKLSGGVNAAAQEVEGNLQTINIEQVMAWDPDVIITGRPQSQVDEIMADPAWAELSAVKNSQVFSNPRGIFAWDRYGVEAALQPQWCAQLLYPDRFEDFDIKEEVKTFYREFLDYELSDEQAQMILDYVTPELDIENQRAA
jgi:iron complex transport system substrate-binding protein